MDDESGSISIMHMQLEWSCYFGKHTNSTRRKCPGWPSPRIPLVAEALYNIEQK